MLESLRRSIGSAVHFRTNQLGDRVVNYCISNYEKDGNPAIFRPPISMLETLVNHPLLGRLYGHFYHYELGRCHLVLHNFSESLDHFEQAVLGHPNPIPESKDFQVYLQGYLEAVKTIVQQEGIPYRHQKGGREWLMKAGDSAMRVHVRFPSLDEVTHEAFTARDWLRQSAQPRSRIQRM